MVVPGAYPEHPVMQQKVKIKFITSKQVMMLYKKMFVLTQMALRNV